MRFCLIFGNVFESDVSPITNTFDNSRFFVSGLILPVNVNRFESTIPSVDLDKVVYLYSMPRGFDNI